MPSKIFYVYRHVREDKNTPFYVGKGHGKRAFSKNRNRVWKRIVAKVGYKVEILKRFNNELEAYAFEEKLIKAYKKFNYCEANLSTGGKNRFKGSKAWNKGLTGIYTKCQRKRLSESKIKAKIWKGKNNPKAKKVRCTKTGKVFDCIAEAAIFYGIAKSTLRGWLNPNDYRSNKSTLEYLK